MTSKLLNRNIPIIASWRPTVSSIVEYKKCFTKAHAICVGVDNFVLDNNTLCVTPVYEIT